MEQACGFGGGDCGEVGNLPSNSSSGENEGGNVDQPGNIDEDVADVEIISFDTTNFTDPLIGEVFQNIGFLLDIISLEIDVTLSFLVLLGGVIGTGVGGLIDGPLVFGDTVGFLAGVGYVEICVQPFLKLSNVIGSYGDIFSISSDFFNGFNGIGVSISETDHGVSVSGTISVGAQSQTELIGIITTWNAQEVILTTIMQGYDTFGGVPWGDLEFNFTFP